LQNSNFTTEQILSSRHFSGASRSWLENKRGIPSIVFLTDEREEIRQQANILVAEKWRVERNL